MPHAIPLPPPAKKGNPIRADEYNLLLALLRSLDVSGGPGIRVKKSPNGLTISLSDVPASRGTGGGSGSGAALYPFDVEFSAGSDEDHVTATVRPGTINGLIPSDIASTFDLDITTTYYLVLTVTATDGLITGATLDMTTVAPATIPVLMGAPPASFDYLLGLVVSGVWFRTIGSGSLSAIGAEVFRTDKATPTPGSLPYDIHYTWAVSNA